MKHRLKGLLALVLSLMMVFALATNAWAMVWIGEKDIGDNSYWTYSNNEWSTGSNQSYNVHLSGESLTLNGFAYSDTDGIFSNSDLTINLIGDNSVTASKTDSSGATAIIVDGNLTIDGTGSLTASGTNEGIHAGNVTIESGTVTATGTNSDGIFASDEVTISGGNVTATGSNGDGINANNITISGGTVTATGSNDNGYGIYALEDNFNGGDITISNGNVTAEGGRVGIGAEDAVTITGGTVIAKGTTPTDSVGIHASGRLGGELTISGATVTATGGGDGGRGISAYDVSIENATVTAAGSATDDGSGNVTYGGKYGIYSSHTGSSSGGEVVIKNSTVTAKAGADGTGIRVEGVIGKTIIQNSTVDIGCKTGINSNYVAILADSSVTIKSTDKAISCSGLSFADATDPALSDSTWYKWSTDNTNFTDSATTELTKEITADTSTLYVVPLSANTNPYPPIIYNPTPTPEPEKVDSAKTFDGGIGLYVTMSILSATGGAWLAKKKD